MARHAYCKILKLNTFQIGTFGTEVTTRPNRVLDHLGRVAETAIGVWGSSRVGCHGPTTRANLITPFADLSADYLDRVDEHRTSKRLVRRLDALGYAVILRPKPAN